MYAYAYVYTFQSLTIWVKLLLPLTLPAKFSDPAGKGREGG
jgi:hypothetical protein